MVLSAATSPRLQHSITVFDSPQANHAQKGTLAIVGMHMAPHSLALWKGPRNPGTSQAHFQVFGNQ